MNDDVVFNPRAIKEKQIFSEETDLDKIKILVRNLQYLPLQNPFDQKIAVVIKNEKMIVIARNEIKILFVHARLNFILSQGYEIVCGFEPKIHSYFLSLVPLSIEFCEYAFFRQEIGKVVSPIFYFGKKDWRDKARDFLKQACMLKDPEKIKTRSDFECCCCMLICNDKVLRCCNQPMCFQCAIDLPRKVCPLCQFDYDLLEYVS
jgi:hypothetical protein